MAGALRRAADNGSLQPDGLLPPEREFATLLGISRATVGSAYEALRRQGYVERRQGVGTWVTSARLRPRQRKGKRYDDGSPGDGAVPSGEFISLTMAAAFDPPELVVSALGSPAYDWAGSLQGHGYHPAGVPELRAAVAQQFEALGIPTAETEVIVTTGAQQGISLLASLLIKPDDVVVVENPTYFGALNAFRRAGAQLRTVPVCETGAAIDALTAAIAQRPRLLYLVPSFQHPTGTVMPPSGRAVVVEQAHAMDAVLIDDMALADVPLTMAATPPPLAHYDKDGKTVVSVGSMSKLFWAGLRVGWVRGSESLIQQLTDLKMVCDIGTPVIDQLLATELLGQIEKVAAARRDELVTRMTSLTSMLSEHLPSWRWTLPSGGLSLWVHTPEGDAAEFAQFAHREGVGVIDGSHFSVERDHRNALRLPFVLEPQTLELAVQRLRRAWDAYLVHLRGCSVQSRLFV